MSIADLNTITNPFSFNRALKLPANSLILYQPLIELLPINMGNGNARVLLCHEVKEWCNASIGKVDCGFEEIPYDYVKGLPPASNYLFVIRFSSLDDMIAFRMRWSGE